MRTEVKAGEFYYSKSFRAVAKVIEIETLWGNDYARIWLLNSDSVVRIPAADLSSLSPQSSALSPQSSALSPNHIAYVAAAAKVAGALEGSDHTSNGHVLLAPMESRVIPLPPGES